MSFGLGRATDAHHGLVVRILESGDDLRHRTVVWLRGSDTVARYKGMVCDVEDAHDSRTLHSCDKIW